MNKGETKRRLIKYLKIHESEIDILDINLLHKNVSTIRARINDTIIKFGFSWETIVSFTINDYQITTNQTHFINGQYSASTAKHKSQLNEYSKTIKRLYIDAKIFDYCLNEILNGREIERLPLLDFIVENNIKRIKISDDSEANAYDLLNNNIFISDTYTPNVIKEIKDIIQGKLWNHKEVTINDTIHIKKDDQGLYDCNKCDKLYKNLSFLNKFDLLFAREII